MISFLPLLDYGTLFHKTSRILALFHCSKSSIVRWWHVILSSFYTGSRQGEILHARLHMKCSSLKEHLYSKAIEPSRLCSCGEVESTSHCRLYCRKYESIERNSLFVSFNRQPLLSVLLYHDKYGSVQYNEHVFMHIWYAYKLILQTARFS